jgi:hypothetical protein
LTAVDDTVTINTADRRRLLTGNVNILDNDFGGTPPYQAIAIANPSGSLNNPSSPTLVPGTPVGLSLPFKDAVSRRALLSSWGGGGANVNHRILLTLSIDFSSDGSVSANGLTVGNFGTITVDYTVQDSAGATDVGTVTFQFICTSPTFCGGGDK